MMEEDNSENDGLSLLEPEQNSSNSSLNDDTRNEDHSLLEPEKNASSSSLNDDNGDECLSLLAQEKNTSSSSLNIEVKEGGCARKLIIFLVPILLFCLLVDWFFPLGNLPLNFSKLFGEKKYTINDIGQWDREEILDHEGRIMLKWNYTKEDITMMVVAATNGSFGIGFSTDGMVTNADIVVAWIENDIVHLEDRFGVNNSVLVMDDRQDYEVLFGNKNQTHTTVIFKRKLNTCDGQDFIISDSTAKIFWAVNDNIPQESQIQRSPFVANAKNAISMNLLTLRPQMPSEDDIEHFDLQIKDVELSYFGLNPVPLVWYCQFVKIPDFGEKHQMIGFEPIYGRKDLVHHILIIECQAKDNDAAFGPDAGKPHYCYFPKFAHREGLCSRVMVTTAVGTSGQFYPNHVGYPFGSTKEKPMYVLIQIHYNLPFHIKGVRDTSGIRIFHTKKVRPNDLIAFNIISRFMQILPPNVAEISNYGICSTICTSSFPKEGIRFVQLFMHAHEAIRKFRIYHFRNNTEINRISDENMGFSFQQQRYLKDELVILPNDTVAIECVYNTSDRKVSTVTGPDSTNEMCMLMVHAYPPINIATCESFIQPEAIEQVFGPPVLNQSAESFAGLNTMILGIAIFGEMTKWMTYEWTKEKQELARKLNLEGPQVPQCINDTTALVYEESAVVRFTDFRVIEPKDICKDKNKE